MNDELAKDIQQSVTDFYEQHGPAFARTRGFVWDEEKLIAEHVKPGMTVVDVGAGNGRFARLILPFSEGELERVGAIKYIGFEPSSTLRASADPTLDLHAGGFPHLELANEIADVTVCLAVLHHLPTVDDRTSAIHELMRITKNGGLIAASAWHLDAPGDQWVPWKAEGADAKRYVHGFSMDEWKQLWNQPGLIIEQISEKKNYFILARKK